MDIDFSRINLLDLRRSEKRRLAEKLHDGLAADFKSLWERIEKTLSQFTLLVAENEEQIYFFGSSMRELVGSWPDSKSLPMRQHASNEVDLVFSGGFLGLSFEDTLERLRKNNRAMAEKRRLDRHIVGARASHMEKSDRLAEDMKELVASIAPGRH